MEINSPITFLNFSFKGINIALSRTGSGFVMILFIINLSPASIDKSNQYFHLLLSLRSEIQLLHYNNLLTYNNFLEVLGLN